MNKTKEQKIDYIKSLKDKGVDDHVIRQEIRKEFKVKKSRGNELYREIFGDRNKLYNGDFLQSKISENKDIVSYHPNGNLEEVVEKLKIDTKQWVVSNYKVETMRDKNVGDYFKFTLSVKRSGENIITNIVNDLKEDLKNYSPVAAKYKRGLNEDGILLEICIFDTHFNKLSWGELTGEDYDSKIASKRFLDAVVTLVERANKSFKIERILFPIGQDFYNSEIDGKTTASTQQDNDSRTQKMFREGRKLLVQAIDILKQYAPVDVVTVVGNHDSDVMFQTGDALECWYHNDKNVIVDNSPPYRKYYQYGDCLIIYTHGSEERLENLPLLAATEKPKLWGETKFRVVHLGHFHHRKQFFTKNADEFQGVRIAILPSISGTDEWHSKKGYNAQKSAEAFVWHKKYGEIANFSYNVVD